MIGLLLKDIYCLGRYLRNLLLVLLVWAVVFFPAGQVNMMIGMICILLVMMLISSLALDQQSKWDGYALTMPLSRRDLVKGKYMTGLIFAICGVLLSLLTGAVSTLFSSTSIEEVALISGISLLLSVIYISIVLPFVYRFGAEKGRFIMVAVFMLAYGAAALSLLADSAQDFLLLEQWSPLALIAALLIVSALAYLLSYRISLAIFRRKEL